ncbi:PHP domain-containing protein [Halalkalicoccus jeotgali]|uniref:PHP domain protein n=1 Tax=Halalkalicoccus jeotgali (strain DSM 18796 / CECT 7217 / JCM 14584 / KCTC 4019 / B3) TaxID=795797 RepID=D8J556_HALJB|nr:PHP domain-containing protein [Halalkalicoccus jeotgali]ADJ13637.1 PHP domain protein [Halalkalicoccus jeotgali B3]ELY33341.1 PHP domain-containing protein [Halalkalicoccus jeotgali B3]
MVYADLHVHTTASDGAMALASVPAAARKAGVAVVAITDHDRTHPDLEAPVSEREDVTLIRGIELRVDSPKGAVDLLGYGVRETPALDGLVEWIQTSRIERGGEIIRRVEDRLGIGLDLEPAPGLGRPHVARAIAAHPESGFDYEGAFAELIGANCPCYVPRKIPDFERGLSALRESCALVGLAHPFRYPDPEAALSLTRELDCVERWYPYGRPVDTDLLDRVIERNGLFATGGSDAHDDRLGRAGLDEVAYREIDARLP